MSWLLLTCCDVFFFSFFLISFPGGGLMVVFMLVHSVFIAGFFSELLPGFWCSLLCVQGGVCLTAR
jgi:hypothetical protein